MDALTRSGRAWLKKVLYLQKDIVDRRLHEQSGRRAVILQYHSVSASDESSFSYVHPSLSIDAGDFDRQMDFLRRRYDVVSLETLLSRIREDVPSSRLPVAITFDDGYKDNYRYAYPILRKHGLPAMFYLTVDAVDGGAPLWTSELRCLMLHARSPVLHIEAMAFSCRLGTLQDRLSALQAVKARMSGMERSKREEFLSEIRKSARAGSAAHRVLDCTMMNWDEIAEMMHNGMDFGAHTLSHPSLPHIPAEEAGEEIAGSKRRLEQRLSTPVLHFSYPNPGDKTHVSPETAEMVRAAGYVSAVTSVTGDVLQGDDAFRLQRKGVYALFSPLPDFYLRIQKEALVGASRLWKRRLPVPARRLRHA